MSDRGRDALAEFERLFSDDAAEEISKSDRLTDRLVDVMMAGIDMIEAIILHGDPPTQIAALAKIMPIATRVAEKRNDAEMNRVVETCRAMFLEIFPDRASVEELHAQIDAEFEIPEFSAAAPELNAPMHNPIIDTTAVEGAGDE